MPRGVPKAGFRRTKNQLNGPVTVTKFMGGVSTPAPVAPVRPSEFSAIERFQFIEDFTNMIIDGEENSFVLTGSGGIGKTTKVTQTLLARGLTEDTPEQPTGDFISIKGFSTPRALYETLYFYKDKIIVLDDADQIFKDPLGANLLKAALDDKPRRVISWNSSRENDEIPARFTYTGRIIFISNLSISQFPQAIISRSQKVDVTLTVEEKVDIIAEVFKAVDAEEEYKADVLAFVRKYAAEANDLNIRSAVKLIPLRRRFGKKWERIAKYSFTVGA